MNTTTSKSSSSNRSRSAWSSSRTMFFRSDFMRDVASCTQLSRQTLRKLFTCYTLPIPICTTKRYKTAIALQSNAFHASHCATQKRCATHPSDHLRNKNKPSRGGGTPAAHTQLVGAGYFRTMAGTGTPTPAALQMTTPLVLA